MRHTIASSSTVRRAKRSATSERSQLIRDVHSRLCERYKDRPFTCAYVGYPPFVEIGHERGISVDVANAIADDLNTTLHLHPADWSRAFERLANDEFSLVLDPCLLTERRQIAVVPYASILCNVLVYPADLSRNIWNVTRAIEHALEERAGLNTIERFQREVQSLSGPGFTVTDGVFEHDILIRCKVKAQRILTRSGADIAHNALDALRQRASGDRRVLFADQPSAAAAIDRLDHTERGKFKTSNLLGRFADQLSWQPAGFAVDPDDIDLQEYLLFHCNDPDGIVRSLLNDVRTSLPTGVRIENSPVSIQTVSDVPRFMLNAAFETSNGLTVAVVHGRTDTEVTATLVSFPTVPSATPGEQDDSEAALRAVLSDLVERHQEQRDTSAEVAFVDEMIERFSTPDGRRMITAWLAEDGAATLERSPQVVAELMEAAAIAEIDEALPFLADVLTSPSAPIECVEVAAQRVRMLVGHDDAVITRVREGLRTRIHHWLKGTPEQRSVAALAIPSFAHYGDRTDAEGLLHLLREEQPEIAWAAGVALADWTEHAGEQGLPQDIQRAAVDGVIGRVLPELANPNEGSSDDLGVTLIWALGVLATADTLEKVSQVLAQAFAALPVQAGASVRGGLALVQRHRRLGTKALQAALRDRVGDDGLERYLTLLLTSGSRDSGDNTLTN